MEAFTAPFTIWSSFCFCLRGFAFIIKTHNVAVPLSTSWGSVVQCNPQLKVAQKIKEEESLMKTDLLGVITEAGEKNIYSAIGTEEKGMQTVFRQEVSWKQNVNGSGMPKAKLLVVTNSKEVKEYESMCY